MRGAHEGSSEATGAGREGQTSPVRSSEDRVVSVVHRGFGGVWFVRAAVWASPAMAVPKRDTFRLFSDYQAVNSQVEQSPGVMPNQEDMRELLGAKCFGKLDLLQGYRQMPLAPEAQEVFTIVTPDGLFFPTRVPQGVLNATCLLYTSPSPRDLSTSRMPSSA